MKALQKVRPARGLELRDVAQPGDPGHGEAIVEVRATGLCGTDLHIYEWTPGYEAMTASMPVTLGHEFSGTIAAIGSGVRGIAVGTLVAVRPSVVCGRCATCVAGDFDASEGKDRRHARWRTGQAGQRSGGELRRCSSGRRCGHCRTDGADDRQRGSRDDGGHQERRSCPRPWPRQHRTGCRAVRAGGRRRPGGDCRWDDSLRLDVLQRMGFDDAVDLANGRLPTH
jgi:threonine dehydrogenase-like Zn-dependent dehydrogenase